MTCLRFQYESVFRVLEPVLGRATEDTRQRRPFFIPTEALSVHFLKHKLAIVCAKGFEIMDLTESVIPPRLRQPCTGSADHCSLKGGSIPIFDSAKVRDRPSMADLQKRCDTAKPLGMFRSTETEFLLCYDCGLYPE
jgi:hypothetical protein